MTSFNETQSEKKIVFVNLQALEQLVASVIYTAIM